MRGLIGAGAGAELSADELAAAYAAPAADWLRVNMVSTVDGAATGADGLTGSVNNAPDHRVFDLLRGIADAVVVGAGTARAEGYRPGAETLVVVTRSGAVPPLLREAPAGSVLLATCAEAPSLAESRALLGSEQVMVVGADTVDLAALRPRLAARGLRQLLCEGGPRLLRDLLAVGAVDELCATVVPRLLAGTAPRIAIGDALEVDLGLHTLLEEDGTLLARWLVSRPDPT